MVELLHGSAGDAVILPMLPSLGEGTGGIEYAAASVLERVALGALVRRERATRIFEIGTFRGVTALSMAVNAPTDAVLWTLDLPPELTAEEIASHYYSGSPTSGFRRMAEAGTAREVGVALQHYTGSCRIEQLFSDAATFDFTAYRPIDLFFIDGCHEYAAALRDTVAAWECLRSGGLLVWHDYTWASVQQAVRDSGIEAAVTWLRQTSLAFARKL